MPPFIASLKQILPQADWPIVVRALLYAPGIWGKLQEEAFSQLTLEKAGSHPANWSPAFFAFAELGQE